MAGNTADPSSPAKAISLRQVSSMPGEALLFPVRLAMVGEISPPRARPLHALDSPQGTEKYIYQRVPEGPGGHHPMARPYKCPYCHSTRTVWKGYRLRKRDKVRLRKCQDCGRRFTTRKTLLLNDSTGEPI